MPSSLTCKPWMASVQSTDGPLRSAALRKLARNRTLSRTHAASPASTSRLRGAESRAHQPAARAMANCGSGQSSATWWAPTPTPLPRNLGA